MNASLNLLLTSASFGVAVGAIFSILPEPINGVAAVLLGACIAIIRLKRRKTVFAWRGLLVGMAAGVLTVCIAIALPVKALDTRVPPFQYEMMRLTDLCDALDRDHGIWVRPRPENETIRIAFSTERSMTKREVLHKLAHDSQTELHIGYCGTGETLLFGAHPSFTRLRGPGRQPDG